MGDNNVGGSNQELSSVSTQEKEIRSKRKHLEEVLPEVPMDVSALSLTEFPTYKLLEENRNAFLEARCDERNEEQEIDEFRQAECDDPLICQYEELLSNSLFAAFRSAIKGIIECGYDEDTAEKIILTIGLFYGSRDVVSNTVDAALALLKSKNVLENSKLRSFENLQSLVEYTMLEMVCVLREMKPSLTVADAMWCLLICDLNLSLACVLEGDCSDGLSGQRTAAEHLADSTNTQLKSEALETGHRIPNDEFTSKPPNPSAQGSQSKFPKVGAAPQSCNSKSPLVLEMGKTEKEGFVPLLGTTIESLGVIREQVQTLPQAPLAEEKSGGSRKGSSVNSKRDTLRQKISHFEKSYKGRMSKGPFKAKFNGWGNMVLDKTRKSASGASGVAMKSTYSKKTTSVGANDSVSEEIHHHTSNSTSLPSASDSPGMLPLKDTVFALPAANAKTPPAPAPELKTTSKPKDNIPSSSGTPDYYAGIPYDKTVGKYVPRDEKDEMILMLVPHRQALQKEMQSWTDWAHEKVMQAACRLSQDQAELKTLRQEKEEAEKLKKDKQTLDENSMKRLSEMEHAWCKANSQIDLANSTVHKLEAKKSQLRQEKEAAKIHALESAKSLQEAMLREQEALKNFQSCNLEKGFLQEDFTTLERNAADLEHQLEKVKGRLKQIEALWKNEEKEKLKALSKVKSIRSRREQQEALAKAEEDDVRQKSEIEMQKCREEMKKLETEISSLRDESEYSRFVASILRGIGMDDDSDLMENKSVPAYLGLQPRETKNRLEEFGAESMKRGRECAMCLTEQVSILFLPCSHQVLCAQCNEVHEKQGFNTCPSCRTPIQRRIHARFAHS